MKLLNYLLIILIHLDILLFNHVFFHSFKNYNCFLNLKYEETFKSHIKKQIGLKYCYYNGTNCECKCKDCSVFWTTWTENRFCSKL